MVTELVLRPIWKTKPEVARKVYPAIRRVFDRARVVLRDEHGIELARNPADWGDMKALGFEAPRQLTRGRQASLPYVQMAEFMADLRSREAVAARALEFLILTGVRTDAVLSAIWAQVDLEAGVWTVPLANLKDRKHRSEAFRVPLSPRALEVARELAEHRVSEFVFPGQKDRGLISGRFCSATTLTTASSSMPAAWAQGCPSRCSPMCGAAWTHWPARHRR